MTDYCLDGKFKLIRSVIRSLRETKKLRLNYSWQTGCHNTMIMIDYTSGKRVLSSFVLGLEGQVGSLTRNVADVGSLKKYYSKPRNNFNSTNDLQ